MKRELEHDLYPLSLSKREFEGLRGQSKPDFFSLNDSFDDGDESAIHLRDFRLDVEESVFLSIYFPLLKSEFEKLSFKEKQILGGFFGVYGYEEHSLSELGEEFDITENSAAKAKDKALKKLTVVCMDGELGFWYRARKAIRKAQIEASLSADRQTCGDNVGVVVPKFYCRCGYGSHPSLELMLLGVSLVLYPLCAAGMERLTYSLGALCLPCFETFQPLDALGFVGLCSALGT